MKVWSLLPVFLFSTVSIATANPGAAPLLLNGELDANEAVQGQPQQAPLPENNSNPNQVMQVDSALSETKNSADESTANTLIRNKLMSLGEFVTENNTDIPNVKSWVLKSGQTQTTFYSVNGSPVLFSGKAFNASNGKPLVIQAQAANNASDGFKKEADLATRAKIDSLRSVTPFALQGNPTGTLPEGFTVLDKLASYSEGKNSDPFKTVYIFFDPTCPWCHKAYKETRKYVEKGYKIKWIPVDFVGGNNSRELAALLLTSSNQADVQRVKETTNIELKASSAFDSIMTADSRQRIEELAGAAIQVNDINKSVVKLDNYYQQINESSDFLLDQFKAHPEIEKKGVPVAFVFDNRIQKPKMVMGISEEVILKDIYGE